MPPNKENLFKQDAKLTGGIDVDDFFPFSLSKDYCLAAVDTLQEFFDALVKVLPVETQQDRKEGMENLMKALKSAGYPEKQPDPVADDEKDK